jgi:hypothetical protein
MEEVLVDNLTRGTSTIPFPNVALSAFQLVIEAAYAGTSFRACPHLTDCDAPFQQVVASP